MSNISFFRYPGGKSRLQEQVFRHLDQKTDVEEYREPFFGGGSIGLKFLESHPEIKRIWINDKDAGIASIWTSVINYPDELKQKIKNFTPDVDSFYKLKKELLTVIEMPKREREIVDLAFKKLAIHQISYSGLGTKSGGPLGGQCQKSDYKIDCRWSPDYMCKKIDKLHKQLSKVTVRENACTCLDFSVLINDTKFDSVIYLDPPYYQEGNKLYQCGFTEDDHQRLATALRKTRHWWVLSYDECPEIRQLYDWATINQLSVKYSITALKWNNERLSRTKEELIITNGLLK